MQPKTARSAAEARMIMYLVGQLWVQRRAGIDRVPKAIESSGEEYFFDYEIQLIWESPHHLTRSAARPSHPAVRARPCDHLDWAFDVGTGMSLHLHTTEDADSHSALLLRC